MKLENLDFPLLDLRSEGEVVEFHSYRREWAGAFRDLNVAWITQFFQLEPIDQRLLDDPESHILALGGDIFFAKCGPSIVGTAALIPLGEGSWEVAKLAVDPAYRGRGIAPVLVKFCRFSAEARGADILVARTSPLLERSYRLFRGLGFQDLGTDSTADYARPSVRLELALNAGPTGQP